MAASLRFRVNHLLFATLAVAVSLFGFERFQTSRWVGFIDLEVGFVVADADSGKPLRGARVEVQKGGPVCEEPARPTVVLISDVQGLASHGCLDTTCTGSEGGLGLTQTFAVKLPCWRYRVTADGYRPTGWITLDTPQRRHQVLRDGPGKAKLVVPVTLQEETK